MGPTICLEPVQWRGLVAVLAWHAIITMVTCWPMRWHRPGVTSGKMAATFTMSEPQEAVVVLGDIWQVHRSPGFITSPLGFEFFIWMQQFESPTSRVGEICWNISKQLRNLVGKSEDGSLIKEFEASHGTVPWHCTDATMDATEAMHVGQNTEVADLWHMHLRGEDEAWRDARKGS